MKNKNLTLDDLILIGSVFGLFSIFFYYISPSFGSWWKLTWANSTGQFDININIFGYNGNKQVLSSLSIYSSLIFIGGVFLSLVSSIKKKLILHISSLLLMYAGLGSFLIILHNSTYTHNLIKENTESNIEKINLFYGYEGDLSWGIGIGFYLALTSTILISIATVIESSLLLIEKKKLVKLNKLKIKN